MQRKKPPKPAKPPGPNVWGQWVDCNRAAGRADPLPLQPDLRAGKTLGQTMPSAAMRQTVMAAYLRDNDRFIVSNGHGLRFLLMRCNKYLNAHVKSADEMTAEELTEKWLDEQHAAARSNGYGMKT